jgi:hypothetical protein
MTATLEESVSWHDTSDREGLGALGYWYETLVMRMMALVFDLTPDRIPGGGNLNCTKLSDRV